MKATKLCLMAMATGAALFLSGCAMQVPSMYNGSHIALVGQTKAAAMTQLGIPTRTMAVNSSQTMYQWDSNQGDTREGSFNADTSGVGVGNSQFQGIGNGVDSVGVSNSSTDGSFGSNTDTHICALSLVVDNASDKIVTGSFTGTVDEKCMNHFRNVVTLDPGAVQANKDAIMHNQHVKEAGTALAVLGAVGVGVAAYNAN